MKTDGLLIVTLTRPHVAAAVIAITLIGAGLSVILREKCGLCGERLPLRVPVDAHIWANHQGDQ